MFQVTDSDKIYMWIYYNENYGSASLDINWIENPVSLIIIFFNWELDMTPDIL